MRQEGIIRVEVGKEGLQFLRETGAIQLVDSQSLTKLLTSGEAEEDSRESTTCLVGKKNENQEEEFLRQVTANPGENEKENDEEELLRRAIALSLED